MGTLSFVATSLSDANVPLPTSGDWAVWEINPSTPSNRRSGGGSLISALTELVPGNNGSYAGDPGIISWTDGTPFTTGNSAGGGVYFYGTGNGFSFTAPAGTGARTLKVYAGAYQCDLRVQASLSDSSASAISYTYATTGGSTRNYIEISYSANSGSQTLTVTIDFPAGSGNVAMRAAHVSAAAAGGTPLTGQSVTVLQGSLSPTASKALTGQSSTLGQGNVTANVTKALTGQVITTGQGSFVDDITRALTGQVITVNQGNVSANNDITRALTGQSITTEQGSLSEVVNKALTGQSITIQQGALTSNASYTITGQSVAISQGNVGDTVSPALTGQQINVGQGNVSSNGDVTKALTGQSISVGLGTITVQSTPIPPEPPNYLSAGGGGTGVNYDEERKKKQAVRLMVEQAFNQLESEDVPVLQQKDVKKEVVKEVTRQINLNSVDNVRIEHIIELIKDYEVTLTKRRNDELAAIILLLH